MRWNYPWWKIGGYFGIAFVVMFIAAIVVQGAVAGEPPSYDEPVAEIRAYWEAEGDNYLLGDYLFSIAYVFLFVPFLVALRGFLGAAEGPGQLFSRTALIGGVLGVALSGAAAASWTALAFGAENLDDSTVTALMYLDVAAWNIIAMPFGVMLLAASIVILGTSILWRPLGIFGVIIGIAAALSPLWILSGDEDGPLGILGFAAFLGLAIWILAASIGMVMRKTDPAVVTVPAHAEDVRT